MNKENHSIIQCRIHSFDYISERPIQRIYYYNNRKEKRKLCLLIIIIVLSSLHNNVEHFYCTIVLM